MKYILEILLSITVAMCIACSQPEPSQHVLERDTLQSVLRTDSGNFLRFSYVIGDHESGIELYKIGVNGNNTPYWRSAYGYDSMLNKILVINSLYDTVKHDYVHQSREVWEYDNLRKPVLGTFYREVRHNWVPISKLARTFDSRGNVTSKEEYIPNGDDWVIVSKGFFEYDSNNQIIEQTNFSSDSLGVWSPIEKIKREYRDSFPILEYRYAPARNNSWILSSKVEHEYNVSNLRVRSTSYIYRANKWIPFVRNDYEYNTSGIVSATLTYFWDEKKNSWKFQEKESW
jgi:hypothetical protein